jgi:competence ComEA-like helix-hairpin-helix protein
VEALTPAERRGALVVVVLLAIGAGHDLWRATRPLPAVPRAGPAPVVAATSAATSAGETAAAEPAGPQAPVVAPPAGVPLDLNRASARDLDALPGIGPVLAGRIVEHRERNGRYGRVEDLLAVRGIGPRLFARLRPRVTVGATAADTNPAPPAGRSRPIPPP